MISGDNINFLEQLAQSLEKALPHLEKAYKSQSSKDFTKIKKFIDQVQKRILEVIE